MDGLFSQFDLATRAGYAQFLQAQAIAFLPAEAALDAASAERVLPDWPERRRGDRLRRDLGALSVPVPEPTDPEMSIVSDPTILGAVYVLEGSRLGGAMLKRTVPSGLPMAFLDASQPRGGWRNLLALMDKRLSRQPELEAAILAARQLFKRFESGAEAQLRTRVA